MQHDDFQMTHLLRTTLALNNDLGFSNARDAAKAILRNNDWRQRFKIPESDADILERWRRQTLSKPTSHKR